MSRHRRVLIALVALLALVAAACGDSDDDSASDSTTTSSAASGATSTTVSSSASSSPATSSTAVPASSTSTPSGEGATEVERLQTQLNAVGCYTGAVDGIDGPETTAAVEAFQQAAGLDADGIPGPQTQGALDTAVANGETVCTGGGGGDGGGAIGDSSVQLASASYSAGFTVRSCDNPTESTLTLSGENENSIELDVMATDGTGTLSVSGGTEQDSVNLTGDVESVMVGDTGAINVTGTFTGADLAGESFTLTGSCA